MLDYKLISADCHVTEHPDAFKRVQKEYADRAPRVVENPQGLKPGLWFMVEGLEPMHVGYFSLGHVIDKPEGRKNIQMYQNSDVFKKQVDDFVTGYRGLGAGRLRKGAGSRQRGIDHHLRQLGSLQLRAGRREVSALHPQFLQ